MFCFVILCDALFALLFIMFPLRYFFPVDPETAVDAPMIDYVDEDPSPFSAELPGKQTPLIIPISPILFSLRLALDFATIFHCSYSDALPVFVTYNCYLTCLT